jgi:hypothetical protein
MSIAGLGRLFNVQPACDGVYINLRDAGGVAFLGYLASTGDTYTVVEAKDGSGTGAQNLVKQTTYWTSTGNASDTWTKQTQAAAATVVTTSAAAQSAVLFEVNGSALSDTYDWVKVTSTGAGTVTAIHRDLMVQRKPSNLAKMG